jgi:hypothetical protein
LQDTILSEDLPGGQRIESILIENPFVLRGGAQAP